MTVKVIELCAKCLIDVLDFNVSDSLVLLVLIFKEVCVHVAVLSRMSV